MLSGVPNMKTWPENTRIISATIGTSMSLRNRIALHYTAATALLIALVFTTLYLMVDRVVYRHIDQSLRREAFAVLSKEHSRIERLPGFRSLEPENDNVEEFSDAPGFRPPGRKGVLKPEFIQFSLQDGTPVKRSANLGLTTLEVQKEKQGLVIFTTTAGGLPVRQIQVPLTGHDSGHNGWLTVARPTRDAHAMLINLRSVLLLSFPAILMTLFVLTRVIAGRSIRPVEEVIATAEAITRNNLDKRIPLPKNQDELYRLSATLNALLERLQEAFQREKQFTSDASHELKTPLAAVMGTLEVLIRKPRNPEHYENRIRRALDELDRMNRLVEQLLMLARHEDGSLPVDIRETSIDEVAHKALERITLKAAEKHITIDTSRLSPYSIKADADLLGLMLENLLMNAIKYSPDGSHVAITTAQTKSTTSCTITDHGEGIPKEKLEAVFDRFYRIDASRCSTSGGFGLGLAIVKKLADLQHITIDIQSHIGQGTSIMLSWARTG